MSMQDEITPEIRDAIEELKRRTINDITPKMREDETLYYRFLKARQFNLKNAEIMLRKHIAFRKEYNVDTILEDYKPPEVLVKYYPLSFLGYDKDGAPVRYVAMSGDSRGILGSAKKKDVIKFNILTVESDVKLTEEQTKKLGKPVTQITYIYNFGDLTFAKATNRKALEMMVLGINIFQDNYPERTKILFHINKAYEKSLLELIDADVLPTFLGGKRTDPDGNPLCHSFVVHPKEVPEHYYLKKSEKTLSSLPGVKKLSITRFSKVELTFEVTEANSYLVWEFETKERDIAFAVYLQEKASKQSKPIEILPKQRIDTYYEPETGMYKCQKAGTYIVIFDNSYSWLRQKEIYYRVNVKGSHEIEGDGMK